MPKHLLPRLHGYELLMAPYAIAHLKIGLKLYETGYRFGSDERARIYLTNALEPAHDFSGTFRVRDPGARARGAGGQRGQAEAAVHGGDRESAVCERSPRTSPDLRRSSIHTGSLTASDSKERSSFSSKELQR